MSVVIGRIRQLDLDRRDGRIQGSKEAFTFKYSKLEQVIKYAFKLDLQVALTINEQGWCDSIFEAKAIKVPEEDVFT